MISSRWKILCVVLSSVGSIALAQVNDSEFFLRRRVYDNSLTHFWKFENNGSPSIGSITLTSTNGVTYDAGKYNFSSAQCGSSRWFTTSSTIVLSNEFTISAWINANRGPGNAALELGMIVAGLGSTNGYFRVQTNFIYLANDGEAKTVTATNAIPSNVWTHVAGTCTATQQAIYVNGARVNTANLGVPFVIRVNTIGTGYRVAAEGGERYSLRGLLDDLRIYNRPLSSGEVFNIYSEAAP